jgi:transcriptional regulator NrdR family protein
MMSCPFCVDGKTYVLDSQWDDRHKTIRRERICLSCHYKWTTLEIDLDQINALITGKTRGNQRGGSPHGESSIEAEGD